MSYLVSGMFIFRIYNVFLAVLLASMQSYNVVRKITPGKGFGILEMVLGYGFVLRKVPSSTNDYDQHYKVIAQWGNTVIWGDYWSSGFKKNIQTH